MPSPQVPTVTIVICARNAAQHLARSVPAALAQDYPAQRLKVLVIDNGSIDDTAEVARRHGARVRMCRKPGVVNARQMGWEICRSELVAYLDADCEPPRDWLKRCVSHLEKGPKTGAVGVRLVSPPPTTLAERHIIEARILDTDRFWRRDALQWPFVVTAGMVVRRRALEQLGGFSGGLGTSGGEDADLCWRLRRAGWTVTYAREIEVLHHHRATIGAMLRQVHWYGRGSSALFARWRRELGWWRFTDWMPYRRMWSGMKRFLPSVVRESDPYLRWQPLLEVVDAAAFLSGKWRESLRRGVLFF